MPDPDYKALCEELVESLENARRIIQGADGTLHINTAEFVLRRARAALAQPEPVAPTDEEIMELMPQKMRDDLAATARAVACGLAITGFERDSSMKSAGAWRIIFNRHAVDHARAVLAHWGTPANTINQEDRPS
jgi:hypothetical protein